MDSSLIFLVIIGLWGAVLVPHWVRRRSALGGSRVRDRFSDAMRVLTRRQAARRPHPQARTYVHRPRPEAVRRLPAAPEPSRPARLPAAGLVLLGLLALLLVTVPAVSVAAAVGVLPFWTPAAALAALLTELVALRLRALRRRQARRQAVRRRPVAPRRAPVAARDVAQPAVPAASPATVSGAAATEPAPASVELDADVWTPVPVPPPTYTLKPTAPRRTVAAYVPPVPAVPSPRPVEVAEPVPGRDEQPQPLWDLDVVLERRRAAAG